MAYTNFTNCTEQEYLDIIYSQDDKNRIRIWFNNVELQDAGEYCISLTGTSRILPNDGSKRFSLSNFVAKEYDLVLRDLPAGTTIADQVKISIGTLVGENTYEDVPIGIFNIQDTPVSDKNKVTIKLRDNRVKFDFGYDAKPLIDSQGGSATYKQILNDICTKAGVTNDVTTFNGESIAVAIYDSSIKASAYVSYIAEQAGAIPVITREGHLNFIYLNNVKTWRIPLSIVEKYEIGKPFEVERVVYESGIIKYQTNPDETLETLYLDAANPYISSQAQVNAVFTIMNGFTIDSATTGRILGNPAIDPYDLIEIYDDDTDDTILKTLANNTYTFNGVHRQTFDTTIGEEERKENVTVTSEATARRWAKTEIDNLNATVTIAAGKVEQMDVEINGKTEYELTNDTTYQQGKTYYVQDGNEYNELNQYATYVGTRTGNPSQLGLYEGLYAYSYVETEDTEFDDIDYYEKVGDNYVLYTGPRTGNPSELNLYEQVSTLINYQLTDDTSFVENKTYFEKNYEIGDTIPSNTIYEAIRTPSVSEQIEGLDASVDSKLSGFSGRINSVESSVESIQTNTYTRDEVKQIVNGTGVDGVVVSATISEIGQFDKDGLLIQKESNGTIISETTGRFNEKGMQIKQVENGSATNEILYAGYVDDTRFDIGSRHYQGKTIVYTQNLQAGGETIIGSNCLLKDYESGTGWFVL